MSRRAGIPDEQVPVPAYKVALLTVGYPGATVWHGGLGWASIGLVRGGGRVVVVDTGGPNLQVPLLKALRAHGVAPDEVTHVLVTHCHWDHISNITLFPNARFVVPGADLSWARKQPPGTWQIADLHVEWLLRHGRRIDEVDDGDEVLPGIAAVGTPGHTPGHCAYQVTSGEQSRLFSGDAVKNRAELLTGDVDMTLDEQVSRASIERLRHVLTAEPTAALIPGHDVQMRLDGERLVLEGHPQAQIIARLGPEGEPVTFDLATLPQDR